LQAFYKDNISRAAAEKIPRVVFYPRKEIIASNPLPKF